MFSQALTASLHSIKGLVPLLTVFASSRDPDKCERSRDRLAQEMKTIRLALAALSALGGFKQSIRPGSHVEVGCPSCDLLLALQSYTRLRALQCYTRLLGFKPYVIVNLVTAELKTNSIYLTYEPPSKTV